MNHGIMVFVITMIKTLIFCSINFLIPICDYFIPVSPLKKVLNKNTNNKPWITAGIKSSCQCKKDLSLLSRRSTDPN
jgi:hypothetical protein